MGEVRAGDSVSDALELYDDDCVYVDMDDYDSLDIAGKDISHEIEEETFHQEVMEQ